MNVKEETAASSYCLFIIKVQVLINVCSVGTEHSSLLKPGGATVCIRLMKMKM